MRHEKTLVVIVGPTASGKTSLSIALAKYFGTSIISIDSRQFYREMDIGTAKPSKDELAETPHFFIGNRSIHDEIYTAGRFEKDALLLLQKLFSKKNIVIACGGSTLYIRALLEGMDEMPPVAPEVKQEVEELLALKGLEGLQAKLNELDPEYIASADVNNARRLIRALEVTLSSGQPFSAFLKRTSKSRDFNIIKIGIELPRELLYQRIEMRCEEMLQNGLLDEVKMLFPYRGLVAMQTVGYSEFFDFMQGKFPYEEAVKLFKQHTRNYAKRQLTWFRKEKDINWFQPGVKESIFKFIENEL